MTLDQTKKNLEMRPFRPFVLTLSSGQTVEVRTADRALLSPHGKTIAVFADNDVCVLVDLDTINTLQTR